MVGFVDSESREGWMMARLQEAELPGAEEDHRFIARKLESVLRRLELQGELQEGMEALLVSGLLIKLGLDPSRSPELGGCWFPDSWLRSVAPLMQNDFPLMTWHWVSLGVLSYTGISADGRARWRVDGAALEAPLQTWHELGEGLVFPKLAEGLAPLAVDDARLRVEVGGLSRKRGRQIATRLKSELANRGVADWLDVVTG